jgi:glutamate-ammonia-ligase adenylyltransferase
MDVFEKFDLKKIPAASSAAAAALHLEKFVEKNPQFKDINKNPVINQITDAIFGNSPFLSEIIIRNAQFYISLFESGFERSFKELMSEVKNFVAEDEESLMRFLREKRNKTSLLIAIAEITELWNIEETTQKLSEFADLVVNKTCEYILLDAHNKQVIELKDPKKPFADSGLVVISLGKLGSNELNYSSDIDLAIYYEDDKLQYKGRKTLAQFYIELAQALTKILSERTKDGYVFRVDMRLRPDPGANPLAVSLAKAEKYYFTVGQNWERAAFTRYRFICGDENSGKIFSDFMGRNVWRISLDFETIEDIHSIKRQIDTRQGLHPDNLYGYNVKLGKGGIREVEFFCQTQQLIWGGRKPKLRFGKITDALYALAKEGEIKQKVADEMEDAYLFFRMVEHRLQMVNDEQTHTLPESKEEMESIAIFCGFKNSKEFLKVLHSKMSNVRKNYSKLFETSPSLASELPEASGSLIFTGTENHPDTLDTLGKMGFADPGRVSDIVRGWHHGRYEVTQKKRARAELTKLMPHLFVAFAKSPNPDTAFSHFDEFLSKLPETSQIFSLLYIKPNVLELLAEVFGGYPEIASTLSKNPHLIEYVIEPDFHKNLPGPGALHKELGNKIKNIKNDEGKLLEVISSWANERKFRIGVQLINNNITTEKIFLNLTSIAEVVLRTVIEIAKRSIEKEYGKIEGGKFGVLCFGKFGSKELTFSSDLDIIFVYDFKKEPKNISVSSYYIKLARKIVALLSSVTSAGSLYEADTRLRPAGESGPLATYIKSLEEYYTPQKESSAWIYEYMALTRARSISLNDAFEKDLQKLVKEKLKYKWDEAVLLKEAKYIHEKYSRYKKVKNILDIKNSEGGLFDLEFLIRFLQLKNLGKYPQIYGYSTSATIEKLHKVMAITAGEYKTIKSAYATYKDVQNILRITSETNILSYTEKILCRTLEIDSAPELYKKLDDTRQQVKKLFEKHM